MVSDAQEASHEEVISALSQYREQAHHFIECFRMIKRVNPFWNSTYIDFA